MYDIEAQISRISGQQNYMDNLQKVTGDPMTVNMEYFHEKHTKLVHCDGNIRVLLRRLADVGMSPDVLANYTRISDELDLRNKTFTVVQKKPNAKSGKARKPREAIAQGYHPPELVKSPWFEYVKTIEKAINKYMHAVFPESTNDSKSIETYTYRNLQDELAKDPGVAELHPIFDMVVTTEQQFSCLGLLKKSCRIVINILLAPMYDVKTTIESHWSDINKIFNSRAFQQAAADNPDVQDAVTSPADIVNILVQFIVAKYRCTVTGNNKHYVKLFVNVLGNEAVSSLDGARFMEIMDSLNLEQFDHRDNVYKFASGAKNIMKHIANADNVTPELLQEIDDIFKPSDDIPAPTGEASGTGPTEEPATEQDENLPTIRRVAPDGSVTTVTVDASVFDETNIL